MANSIIKVINKKKSCNTTNILFKTQYIMHSWFKLFPFVTIKKLKFG